MAFAPDSRGSALPIPHPQAGPLTTRQASRNAADRSFAPPNGAFDTGLRPDPFPDRAASLLPGLLTATRTGLTPASDNELQDAENQTIRFTSIYWAHEKSWLTPAWPMVPDIQTLGRTRSTWGPELFNHHSARSSNGPTEGMNLCTKELKRARFPPPRPQPAKQPNWQLRLGPTHQQTPTHPNLLLPTPIRRADNASSERQRRQSLGIRNG